MRAMKCLAFLVAAAGLAGCNERPAPDEMLKLPNPVYGSPLPDDVHNWFRLAILGSRNGYLPLVWISADKFERSDPGETLITLSPTEYEKFAAFSRTYRCPIAQGQYAFENTLEVFEHSGQQGMPLCVMPHSQACSYLSEVAFIEGNDWTNNGREAILELGRALNC